MTNKLLQCNILSFATVEATCLLFYIITNIVIIKSKDVSTYIYIYRNKTSKKKLLATTLAEND